MPAWGKLKYAPLFLYFLLLYATFFIMPALQWASSNFFAYQNGFDEPYYLSYQASIHGLTMPGYFVTAALVYLLHHAGMTPAVQNLLLDLLVPAGAFLAMFFIIKHFVKNVYIAGIGALLILFSNIFFSFSVVPFLKAMVAQNFSWFLAAQGNAVAMRSPNPQIPILLVSMVALAGIKTRRWWLLLLPLPILYFTILIPYAYALAILFIIQKTPRLGLPGFAALAALLNAAMYVVERIAFTAASQLFKVIGSTHLGGDDYGFLVSPTLIFCTVLLVVFFILDKYGRVWNQDGRVGKLLAAAWLFILFAMNQHLISGFNMSPTNTESHANTLVAMVALVILLSAVWYQCRDKQSRAYKVFQTVFYAAMLLVAGAVIISANGFDFRRGQFRVLVYFDVPAPYVARVKQDPAGAVCPDPRMATRLSMIVAKGLAPPLSTIYIHGASTCCDKYLRHNQEAYAFAQANMPRDRLGTKRLAKMQRRLALIQERDLMRQRVGYGKRRIAAVCPDWLGRQKSFYLVPTVPRPYWRYVPAW